MAAQLEMLLHYCFARFFVTDNFFLLEDSGITSIIQLALTK